MGADMAEFQEGYARGGIRTLYITKEDAKDVVRFLMKQGSLREIQRAVRQDELDERAERQVERESTLRR
jgi:hypothetical protein